jgi:hypothetical protein
VVQGDRSPTGCEVARNTFRDDAANPRQRGSVTAQWHLTGECSCEAYDADERVINPLAAAGKRAVIPPKANRRSPREVDRHLYKARHLIENFFAKLKQFRALATRYDKTARNFLAAVHIAAIAILLN